MKNILVMIHDDDGQEARLQAALDVTRAVNGHLTCLDVSLVTPFVGDATGISGGAMLIEMERSSEAANRARLEPRLAREGVSWDWIDTTDYAEPAIENAATLADLIVVNRAVDSLPMPDMRNVAASLIVNSGKPILAVPNDAKGLNVAGTASHRNLGRLQPLPPERLGAAGAGARLLAAVDRLQDPACAAAELAGRAGRFHGGILELQFSGSPASMSTRRLRGPSRYRFRSAKRSSQPAPASAR